MLQKERDSSLRLGYRGNFAQQLAAREPKAVELFAAMEEVKEEAAKFMKVRAVWQFFEAEADGEQLHVFAPGQSSPAHTWKLKRQKIEDRLCLSDYILPGQSGKRDHVALFVGKRRRRSAGTVGSGEERGILFPVARIAVAGD